jgi:hypothetical protein
MNSKIFNLIKIKKFVFLKFLNEYNFFKYNIIFKIIILNAVTNFLSQMNLILILILRF